MIREEFEDVRDVNLGRIEHEVEEEADEIAAKKIEEILAGH